MAEAFQWLQLSVAFMVSGHVRLFFDDLVYDLPDYESRVINLLDGAAGKKGQISLVPRCPINVFVLPSRTNVETMRESHPNE